MSLRLLIADDNHDMANLLAKLLRREGFEVQTAGDGEEAVDGALAFHPDILILDLCMPRLGGLEVATHLRSLDAFAGKVFIAITGYTDAQHLDQISQSQFDAYLIKPFRLDRLTDVLHDVSGRLQRVAAD
jgi:CheY-like chemotaxis protein